MKVKVDVTEDQVKEALAGIRVKIPDAVGGLWVLWVRGGNLSLTRLGEPDIL